jgi:hypothetical protein
MSAERRASSWNRGPIPQRENNVASRPTKA